MKAGLISAQRHETRSTMSSDDHRLPEFFNMQEYRSFGSVLGDSPDTAMKIAAVYRSVSILSGTIASLPIYPRRKSVYGNFEIDEKNPLYYLLGWKASDRLNSYEMFESAVTQILMQGNAYIFPKYSNNHPAQLILLRPGSVSYDEVLDRYHVHDIYSGVSGIFDSWRIIHLRNKNLDGGKQGISTIQYASRILNISANADDQTLSNMKSGNKQKGFLTGGSLTAGMGKLQDEEVERVARRLEDQLESNRNVLRLPGELQWHPYSISPADAQILENRKFSLFDVCRFFGVHPDKVFIEQTSNYKASENSQTSFMTDTLQPLLVQIEKELSTKLIPRSMVGRKEVVMYDREALYQLDPINAATYFDKMFGMGGLTANEIRIKSHLRPVEGGDTQFVSTNVAPIGSAKISGEPTKVDNDPPQEED